VSLLLSDDGEEPDVIPIASTATALPATSGSATSAEPANLGGHERTPHGKAPHHPSTPGKRGPLEGRY